MLAGDDIGVRVAVDGDRHGEVMAHVHVRRQRAHVDAAHRRIPQLTQADVRLAGGIDVQQMAPLRHVGHQQERRIDGMQLLLHRRKVGGQLIRLPAHVVRPHHKRGRIPAQIVKRIAAALAVPDSEPVVLRRKRVKRRKVRPIRRVQRPDIPVALRKPPPVPPLSIPVKAGRDDRVPHAADRKAFVRLRVPLAVQAHQPGDVIPLAILRRFGPVAVPASVAAVRADDGFAVDRRAEADVGIQVVAIEVKRHEGMRQPLAMGSLHHVLLLRDIFAGLAARIARAEILPRLAVQLNAVEAHAPDGLHGLVNKRPVVKGRAIEIAKPEGHQGLCDVPRHHAPSFL